MITTHYQTAAEFLWLPKVELCVFTQSFCIRLISAATRCHVPCAICPCAQQDHVGVCTVDIDFSQPALKCKTAAIDTMQLCKLSVTSCLGWLMETDLSAPVCIRNGAESAVSITCHPATCQVRHLRDQDVYLLVVCRECSDMRGASAQATLSGHQHCCMKQGARDELEGIASPGRGGGWLFSINLGGGREGEERGRRRVPCLPTALLIMINQAYDTCMAPFPP